MEFNAQTIKALCALAVKQAFDTELVPKFEAATGHALDLNWDPTTLLIQRIEAGERGDVVLAIDSAMDRFESEGLLQPGSRFPLASAYLGLAVRAGAPHPDISTLASFCDTLTETRGIAVSKAGASGIYFREMIASLGIETAVTPRIVPIDAGFTATKVIDGSAALAVQQVSELMTVDGVEIVGPFPEEVQTYTHFSVAAFRDAPHPEAAAAFLAALRAPDAPAALEAGGLKSRNQKA